MSLVELDLACGERLHVHRFSVREAISSLFAVKVLARSPDPCIDLRAILGQPAVLRINSGYRYATGGERVGSGLCHHVRLVQAVELRATEVGLPDRCVQEKLKAMDRAAGGMSPYKPQVPYDMSKDPPEPIPSSNHPGPTTGRPGGSKVPDEAKAILEEGLSVVDEEGTPVLQIALLATVYFEDAHQRGVREAVVACLENYLRRCGQELRWSLSSVVRRLKRYGEGKDSRPRDWMLEIGEDEDFSLLCHGARSNRGASMFHVAALGDARRPFDQLGCFQVAFPLPWFSEHPGSLPEVLLDICRELKPASGYGGIGIIECPEPSFDPERSQAWLRRFDDR